MLFRRPAVRNPVSPHRTVVDPFQPRDFDGIEIFVGENGRRMLAAVFQVDDQLPHRPFRIRVAVHPAASRSRQFGIHVRIEPDPVIPRFDKLLLVRITAADAVGTNLLLRPYGIHNRKEHDVLIIGSAAARFMGVAETVDQRMVVVVAGSGEISIRPQLHHSKRSCRHRHDTSGRPGSHHRPYAGSRFRSGGKPGRTPQQGDSRYDFTIIHLAFY